MLKTFMEFVDSFNYSDIKVAKLYQQNPTIPVKELAYHAGKSVSEFYRILKKYNVTPSRLRTNQHLVLSYANQGYPVSEIAQFTGYSPNNVRKIIKKNLII